MSKPKPLKPLAPHLAPMADALAAAEQAARQQVSDAAAEAEAKRKAEQEQAELEDDARAIKDAFKRGGMKLALAMGRSCKTSWTADQVEDLIYPPEPPAPAGGGDDGGLPPSMPQPDEGDEPPKWKLKKNPVKKLPKDCPVIPLGIDGEVCFYLTPNGQFLPLDSHAAEGLRKLFAPDLSWLWNNFPKFKENTGEQTNWDAAKASDSLIQACGKRGPFDPSEKLRGQGAWRLPNGELVLHCGDRIFDGAAWQKPGYLLDHVYPGAPALPKPFTWSDDEPEAKAEKRRFFAELDALLTILDSWNWAAEFEQNVDTGERVNFHGTKHKISSLLVLGWICSALVGGALDWRPMIWLTGEAASGKSTLQKLVAAILGLRLVTSSDATAAGIYQSVGYSSRAAGIDEAEADPNSQKMKGMVELVRQSSSGGNILRGSNDPKKWRGFTARSSFLLSSIVIPPLFGQDLTRITILPLAPLPKGSQKPKIDQARWAAFGTMLLRRLVDNWYRWEATLESYAIALGELGHDGRGGEQLGGLLAMADMVRFDEIVSDDIALCCVPFDKRNQPKDETTSQQFLNWLITKTVVAFRGGNQMTIGALVAGAAGLVELSSEGATPYSYATHLHAHGVFVEGFKDQAWVTLPNQSAGLAHLLDGSPWGTKPGAALSGWQQAMQRLCTARGPDGQALGRKVNTRKLGIGRGWSLPAKIFLRMEEE
ncbi:hypothetical protein [Bosea minatitlanensis]|uniref:DUF927 domain-containing protein n=1 Tax=Bosea minatitlanensis TaxID=128782 RepID=A0ABW0EZB1_9HYPH|nr:hypothetical protein [Bosea minatitlanensis]MCT4496053.1 hypothetical protein [Bosea minatitlanensis]